MNHKISSLSHLLYECFAARVSDRSQVRDELVLRHTDTVVLQNGVGYFLGAETAVSLM